MANRGNLTFFAAIAIFVLAASGTGYALVTAPRQSSAPITITMPRTKSVLFIGASYTVGLGASSPEHGYAREVAAALDWPAQFNAVSGSGYLNPSRNLHSAFGQRIKAMSNKLRPGLVLIQGGRNDMGYPVGSLRQAICAAVQDVRQRFDDPQLVLFGNVPATAPASGKEIAVEHAMIRAARACRVAMIDPIAEHWITRQNAALLVGTVPAHPNDAGYSYIATRVLTDLAHLSGNEITPTTKSAS